MLKVMIGELLTQMRGEITHQKSGGGPSGDVGNDIHQTVCVRLADQFELWDLNDCFPVWLSRMVADELADAEAGDGWWWQEAQDEDVEGHKV